jgi:hypothetical protein
MTTKKMAMASPNKNLDQALYQRRLELAAEQAELLIERLQVQRIPVDPTKIAASEGKLIRLCPGNYKDAFDGCLEFLPERGLFLCYYNTKYDRPGDECHAARTRFSLAHELGHFFIESHHQYLRSGGRSHGSKSEFVASMPVERQADMFAAHLLMPDRVFKPLVNQGELSADGIIELAQTFATSCVSTALRAIECTHFFCAAAVLRDGKIAWLRPGRPLIECGIYPGERGTIRSPTAQCAWRDYTAGERSFVEQTGWARDWFRIYDEGRQRSLSVTEAYIAVPVMNSVLVLLTVPEDELLDAE